MCGAGAAGITDFDCSGLPSFEQVSPAFIKSGQSRSDMSIRFIGSFDN